MVDEQYRTVRAVASEGMGARDVVDQGCGYIGVFAAARACHMQHPVAHGLRAGLAVRTHCVAHHHHGKRGEARVGMGKGRQQGGGQHVAAILGIAGDAENLT